MKFTKGDMVICIEDAECDGSARPIKKGEIMETQYTAKNDTVIWFRTTPCGAGNYKTKNFMLVSEYEKLINYEIY